MSELIISGCLSLVHIADADVVVDDYTRNDDNDPLMP